jgi:hypothetical protein
MKKTNPHKKNYKKYKNTKNGQSLKTEMIMIEYVGYHCNRKSQSS